MADELALKIFHSNGWDNRNPDNDLGGQPSKFEVAQNSLNNLFSDVSPEDALAGLEDYRCIYVINKSVNTYNNVTISISGSGCANLTLGPELLNDQQIIKLIGDTPDDDGFLILKTEFGAPFTCYWTGNSATFAAEIQDKIRLIEMCDSVTVVEESSMVYRVTFLGAAKNRLVKLIDVIQNNLIHVRDGEYRISDYVVGDVYNGAGDSQIRVTTTITDAPTTGSLHVFNVNTGLFEEYEYSGYAGQVFSITTPLASNLVYGDEVWVNMTDPQKKCIVTVTKYVDGSPINRFANIIPTKSTEPDEFVAAFGVISIGTLKPLDGFFVWIKRTTPEESVCCPASATFAVNY